MQAYNISTTTPWRYMTIRKGWFQSYSLGDINTFYMISVVELCVCFCVKEREGGRESNAIQTAGYSSVTETIVSVCVRVCMCVCVCSNCSHK